MVFLGLLPAVAVPMLFVTVVQDDSIAFDFRAFHRAAHDVLAGEDPYPAPHEPVGADAEPYVYPPLGALVSTPLTALSVDAAGLLVMVLLVLCVPATLLALGVRDWRCHGLAFLWPPVLAAVQSGNLTLLLGLGAALVWRLRERAPASAGVLACMVAAKPLLWPLAVWHAAAGRARTALLATAATLALLGLSWAAIGFDGLGGYGDLLRRLENEVGEDAYTVRVLALDAGIPDAAARAAWLAVGGSLLAAVVALGRRGRERPAFALAVVAAVALSPLVWLHYFALLLVVVALLQPRLGPAWFVPLALVVTPGSGHPTPFETTATLGAAALTVLLALRPGLLGGRPGGGART
ncbi:MAG TPA: glycosyltransferase 87 family protein [Gaiellaceae bacterium]|nr:glycosyltransferase 87 family protein [Gaiellaceae bacterium]